MQEVETGAKTVVVGKTIVELSEVKVAGQSARNQTIKAWQKCVDGGALRWGGSRLSAAGRGTSDEGLSSSINRIPAEAVDHWKVASREIDVQEVEQLVFFERTADGSASLVANLVRVEGCKRIAGVEGAITEEPVGGAVNVVSSTLGNGVDDATHCPAVFGGEISGNNLELLDCVLGELRGNAGAA